MPVGRVHFPRRVTVTVLDWASDLFLIREYLQVLMLSHFGNDLL